MPTSERDVLDLLDQAAMDPPQMGVDVQGVLAMAQARRRSRRVRHGSMALAAVVLVAVAWVGFGSGFDEVLGDDIQPAEKTEWDDTVDFEAPLTSDGPAWQGFVGASVLRAPGDAEFSVTLPDGRESVDLAPVEGDLPEGVDVFTNNGASLIVTEDSYDGSPFLDLARSEEAPPTTQLELSDSGVTAHAWVLSGEIEAFALRDIYWLLPDQVATSRGGEVINEVIEAGGEEIPIMIVETTGVWAERSWEGMRMLASARPDSNELFAQSRDDVVFAVLPGDARNPVFRVFGRAFDSENRMVEADREVQPSVRFVGDYQVAWAEVDQGDFVSDGFAYVEAQGLSSDPQAGLSLKVEDAPDGAIDVQLSGSKSSVRVEATSGGQPAVSTGPDGSALAVGWMSDVPLSDDQPGGPDIDLVFDTPSGLTRGQDLGPFGIVPLQVPQRGDLFALALPRGTLTSSDADPLPTLLYRTGTGPQWAGQPAPQDFSLAGHEVRVSVDDSLNVWAVECDGNVPAVGRVGAARAGLVICDTEEVGTDDVAGAYVVLVLPADIAETATAVPDGQGLEPDSFQLGEPVLNDVGEGLSLWAVPIPLADYMFEGSPGQAIQGIKGIDLDGDGTAD